MAVGPTGKNDDWAISSFLWMKKITVGIKENDKVIFLRTEEISDEFNSQKLIKAVETVIKICLKQDMKGDMNGQTNSH